MLTAYRRKIKKKNGELGVANWEGRGVGLIKNFSVVSSLENGN